jgi:pectate lyase
MTHYVDEDNHIYATLRSSNTVSLRRLVHGEIEVLGEATLNVTPGTWYTLRMETVGNSVRLFVNGTQVAAANNVGPPEGQIALATYKAAADFDDFLAYQP